MNLQSLPPRAVLAQAVLPMLLLGACAAPGESDPIGLALLGAGSNSLANVEFFELLSAEDGLDEPRDIAFNPAHEGELWVVNLNDHSVVIADPHPGEEESMVANKVVDNASGQHFMARPSALAFGMSGTMATIHDEDSPTQGGGTPADFMGPTLWDSKMPGFNAGHAAHLDMLHNSPNGAGIAWDSENAYWIFDGHHSSLTRYDFQTDHDRGGADHSDGIIARYVAGEVAYQAGTSSHLDLDHESGALYVADTGNGRIAVLDTNSGERGKVLTPNYDRVDQYEVEGASLSTLAGAEIGLQAPSGIALHDGIVFVSDNATSHILAIDSETGEVIDWLDTELPSGSLAGLAFDPEGNLLVADSLGNRIFRVSAP